MGNISPLAPLGRDDNVCYVASVFVASLLRLYGIRHLGSLWQGVSSIRIVSSLLSQT